LLFYSFQAYYNPNKQKYTRLVLNTIPQNPFSFNPNLIQWSTTNQWSSLRWLGYTVLL